MTDATASQDLVLSVSQAARQTGIPVAVAYHLISRLRLGERVGRSWQLSPADVARLAAVGEPEMEARPMPANDASANASEELAELLARMPPGAMTVGQAARLIGISVNAASCRMRHRGLGTRVGGKWRLSLADVARLAGVAGDAKRA